MGPAGGIALAAIAAGATIGKMSAEKEAAEADLSAINQQSKLLALQYQQKNIQNLEATDKILNRQAAQLSVRGVTFDSPSFNAIQRETINAGARKTANLQTEQSIAEQGLAIEKQNVKRTLHTQLFGDATTLAFGALEISDRWPTKSNSTKLPSVEDL